MRLEDMTKIECKYAEVEQVRLYVGVELDGKNRKKKLLVIVVDDDGTSYKLGCFTAHAVSKKKAVHEIADVIPQLLSKKEKDSSYAEMNKIQEKLMDILCDTKGIKSKEGVTIKEVHAEVCEYVKANPRKDYYTIEGDMCQIRYDELDCVLGAILGTDWKRLHFAEMLEIHGMVELGDDRRAKKVADSNMNQYRALVFSTTFKEAA